MAQAAAEYVYDGTPIDRLAECFGALGCPSDRRARSSPARAWTLPTAARACPRLRPEVRVRQQDFGADDRAARRRPCRPAPSRRSFPAPTPAKTCCDTSPPTAGPPDHHPQPHTRRPQQPAPLPARLLPPPAPHGRVRGPAAVAVDRGRPEGVGPGRPWPAPLIARGRSQAPQRASSPRSGSASRTSGLAAGPVPLRAHLAPGAEDDIAVLATHICPLTRRRGYEAPTTKPPSPAWSRPSRARTTARRTRNRVSGCRRSRTSTAGPSPSRSQRSSTEP